jgi:hypothetical protein
MQLQGVVEDKSFWRDRSVKVFTAGGDRGLGKDKLTESVPASHIVDYKLDEGPFSIQPHLSGKSTLSCRGSGLFLLGKSSVTSSFQGVTSCLSFRPGTLPWRANRLSNLWVYPCVLVSSSDLFI